MSHQATLLSLVNFSSEDFPTLGGPAMPTAKAPQWSKKAIQNNKPVTRPRGGGTRTIVPTHKAPEPVDPRETSAPGDHSAVQWSQAPDVFVEKSQLQLRAEKEAKQAGAKNKNYSAPSKDQQSFPTLGGGGKSSTPAFWGVPGNSIPKSASKKGKKKGTLYTHGNPGSILFFSKFDFNF